MSSLFDRLCNAKTLLLAWKAVRRKGSAGGVDGVSIDEYDEEIGKHLGELKKDLEEGAWKPEPYLRISIPKNETERRRLGLLCVRDKIVQQAIKTLIEPRFDGMSYLHDKLGLELNEPQIIKSTEGFEFLGIYITDKALSITKEKQKKLQERICELVWEDNGFSERGLTHLEGVGRYYAPLLSEKYLSWFDDLITGRVREIINDQWQSIPDKTSLNNALKGIRFYSEDNILRKSEIRGNLVNHYVSVKADARRKEDDAKNRKLVRQRKLEYRQKESEATDLIINTFGTSVGVNNSGITIKVFGSRQVKMPPTQNLRHITILCNGVSISSNAVKYCMENRIPIDYFSQSGQHLGSILSNSFMSYSLWQRQAAMSQEKRAKLARNLILGKLKNQLNLIKYFHKYHKNKKSSCSLCEAYDRISPQLESLINKLTEYKFREGSDYREYIMGKESAGAVLYWDYIRSLVEDDDVADTRKRNRVMKLLGKFGTRVNLSVYECMFTDVQLRKVKDKVRLAISEDEDSVVFYPICLDCFTKITYVPRRRISAASGEVIVV